MLSINECWLIIIPIHEVFRKHLVEYESKTLASCERLSSGL